MKKFTAQEEYQIFAAAAKTWSYVESEAAQLGSTDIDMAIELVLDADRIVDIGKLSKKLCKDLMACNIRECDAFMKKNKNMWYC